MPDISHITLPDSNTYNLIDASKSGVYTVIGTQTTATVNLTGNLHNISALYDGLTIVYYSPQNIQSDYSGDIVNLNLTLDDGTTTGAINCWIGSNQRGRYANTSDGLSSKCTLIMTYWSSAWSTPRWVILADTGLSLITRTTVTGGGSGLPIPMVSGNTLNTNYSLVHPLVPHPDNNEVLKFNPATGNLITTQLNGTPIPEYAKQVSLTQAEYDALVSAGTVDLVSTVYFITDASATACSALEVTYSNTSSGLSATNVQNAIDEVTGDIPSNSDFSLAGLSDTTISSPSANQVLYYNGSKWANIGLNSLMPTTITVTKGSSMPSGFPTPTVTRRGNVCIVNFAIQIPVGTYSKDDALWTISPKPVSNNRCVVAFAADPNNFININVLSDGTIKFNGNKTVSSDSWLIGQCMYLTDGVS